jgi:uncharacterized protein YbaP (TraB family)
MTPLSVLALALALATLSACPSPSHPTPVYEPAPSLADTPARSTGAEGPTEREETTTVAPPTEPSRPFVYEVRPRDPDVPASYLFGTLGRGLRVDQALPERHRTLLHSARAVVVPIDQTAEMLVRDVQRVMLVRRGSAADLYPPRIWQALTHELRDEMPLDQLRMTRPFVHVAGILRKRARELFPDAPSSMDLELFAYARERGLTLRTLGTPLDEMRIVGAAPDRELVALATLYVDRPEVFERDLREAREAYLAGDEARVDAADDDPEERTAAPTLYRGLERRRDTWLRPIRRELDEGNAFVAFPAGAWVGPEGLVEKLRRAGYTVTRLD